MLANSASPIGLTVAIVSVIAYIQVTTSAVLAGCGRAIIPILAVLASEAGGAVAHVIPRVPRVGVTFALYTRARVTRVRNVAVFTYNRKEGDYKF